MKIVKCIVAGVNANGEPDLYFVKVQCSEAEYGEGHHYNKAKESAEGEGYEPCLAFDEHDVAGNAMLILFNWDTASII